MIRNNAVDPGTLHRIASSIDSINANEYRYVQHKNLYSGFFLHLLIVVVHLLTSYDHTFHTSTCLLLGARSQSPSQSAKASGVMLSKIWVSLFTNG